ncbi:MAG: hypothetical protein AAFR28_12745 [Pseudomonadota bacterium]
MTEDDIDHAGRLFADLAARLEDAHETALDGQHPRITAEGLSSAGDRARGAVLTALMNAEEICTFIAARRRPADPDQGEH